MKRAALSLCVLGAVWVFSSCTAGTSTNTGPQGEQGPQGDPGQQGPAGPEGPRGQSFAMSTSAPPAGICPGSGTEIRVGLDQNGNGALDPEEVDPELTRYLCDGVNGEPGAPGAAVLAASNPVDQAPGCPDGGVRLDFGVDADGDGDLDPGEINETLTQFVCSGARGPQGIRGDRGDPGPQGAGVAMATSPEAASEECPAGGVRIDVGVDVDGDGALGPAEIDPLLSRLLCNGPVGERGPQGEPGAQGPQGVGVAALTTLEGSTPDCPAGGTRIELGIDANGNGALDPGELDPLLTRRICNGQAGPQGIEGQPGDPGPAGPQGRGLAVSTASEGPTASCATGGVVIFLGVDANGNGALEESERDPLLTQRICNGGVGPQGVQGQKGETGSQGATGIGLVMASAYEAAPAACEGSGVRLEFGLDLNRNGLLDAGERDDALTRYVCDGTAGDDAILNQDAAPQVGARFDIDGRATSSRLTVTGANPVDLEPALEVLNANAPASRAFSVFSDGFLLGGGAYDGGISSGGLPAEGAGTRMMWYPSKASFRAGYVDGTQWDDANIGYFSVAMGQGVRASGDNSVALGVRSTAAGSSTFAAGEDNAATGAASVALGYHAHTNARQGTFVFGDRSTVDTIRAGVNHSANWRVSGGFRIYTSSNLSTGVTIQSGASVSNWGQSSAVISTSTGAMLTTGGVWQNASDVRRKHGFEEVSTEDVLARLQSLPITRWSYRVEGDGIRHLGPTSQDFRAAFGLGSDETSIGTVDADGVALASAQALAARTDALRSTVADLNAENASLRKQLSALEARLRRMEEMLARQEDRRR